MRRDHQGEGQEERAEERRHGDVRCVARRGVGEQKRESDGRAREDAACASSAKDVRREGAGGAIKDCT